jgi:hypothetical protein
LILRDTRSNAEALTRWRTLSTKIDTEHRQDASDPGRKENKARCDQQLML